MIKAIALLLALYGTYSLYAVFSGQGYLSIIGAVLALAAAVGLWLHMHWSQYVVYVLSASFVAEWLWLVWRSIQQKSWPHGDALRSVIALFPGLCLVALVVSVSVLVFKSFRAQSHGILGSDRKRR